MTEGRVMMTRGLVSTFIGMFFAWGLNTSALAADKSIGFSTPAVTADELGQIRGGMTNADLIEGLAGVPEAALAAKRKAKEVLIVVSKVRQQTLQTISNVSKVRASIGQIATTARESATGFGDGIRGRIPSAPNPVFLNPEFLNPL